MIKLANFIQNVIPECQFLDLDLLTQFYNLSLFIAFLGPDTCVLLFADNITIRCIQVYSHFPN